MKFLMKHSQEVKAGKIMSWACITKAIKLTSKHRKYLSIIYGLLFSVNIFKAVYPGRFVGR